MTRKLLTATLLILPVTAFCQSGADIIDRMVEEHGFERDALTATLAAEAGFEALYLSGAALAYTRLGRPDIGLTSLSEMADTMALIREVGYGTAYSFKYSARPGTPAAENRNPRFLSSV